MLAKRDGNTYNNKPWQDEKFFSESGNFFLPAASNCLDAVGKAAKNMQHNVLKEKFK